MSNSDRQVVPFSTLTPYAATGKLSVVFQTMSYVKATDNIAFCEGVDRVGESDTVRIIGIKMWFRPHAQNVDRR